jgi:hypothetical protein
VERGRGAVVAAVIVVIVVDVCPLRPRARDDAERGEEEQVGRRDEEQPDQPARQPRVAQPAERHDQPDPHERQRDRHHGEVERPLGRRERGERVGFVGDQVIQRRPPAAEADRRHRAVQRELQREERDADPEERRRPNPAGAASEQVVEQGHWTYGVRAGGALRQCSSRFSRKSERENGARRAAALARLDQGVTPVATVTPRTPTVRPARSLARRATTNIGRTALSATFGHHPPPRLADLMGMRIARRVGMLLLLAFVAAPTTAAHANPGASAAPTPAGKKTYSLKARPTVGQRIAYEQSLDTTLRINANAGGNRRAEASETTHEQTVVLAEQIIEIGKPPAISKQVTFGPQCWSATKTNDRPVRKVGSIYAGKTVLFRIFEDGTLEQDFGVKPTRAQQQRMKNMFVASADLYPERPVTVGERWRADRAMAALFDLSPDDTSSTIFTLKEVRQQNGRDVAVVAVSAAVIKQHARGFNVEMSLEGSWQIDVETGAELKIDLTGKCTIAVLPPKGKKSVKAVPSGVQVTGEGTIEMHRTARLLGPEEPVTTPTAPTQNTAAAQ